jgi:squalene cyclase
MMGLSVCLLSVILLVQNNNGGFATYELTRSYAWLEILNPSETFGDIMIDYPYVECTSGVIQGLTAFRKHYPGHRREEIDNCIQKADSFIQSIQRSDGSWFVPRTPFRREHVTHCFFLKKKCLLKSRNSYYCHSTL